MFVCLLRRDLSIPFVNPAGKLFSRSRSHIFKKVEKHPSTVSVKQYISCSSGKSHAIFRCYLGVASFFSIYISIIITSHITSYTT